MIFFLLMIFVVVTMQFVFQGAERDRRRIESSISESEEKEALAEGD